MVLVIETRVISRPGSRREGRAVAAAAVSVVLWASAFVAIRGVGHALSAAPLALIRLAVAAVALTVLVLLRRRRTPLARPSGKALLPVAAYAVLWLAGYTVALNAADQR